MCTLCAATIPFEPDCVYTEAAAVFANFIETTDAAASVSTTYTMGVGDTFSGSIGTAGDTDWVRVTIGAGETVTFTQESGGADPLGNYECKIQLRDASGNVLANESNYGINYSSTEWTNSTGSAATVYIVAADYETAATGTYTLTAISGGTGPTDVYTHDEIADVLMTGYWGDGPYTWDVAPGDTITFNVAGLTATGKTLARYAFDAWEMVSGIVFSEVGSGGDIVLDDADSGAYADFQFSGYTIQSGTVNIATDWLDSYGTTIDSYSFQTYIHEIGHALGLGHAGTYNGNATYGVDNNYLNDSWQATVMSYFDQVDNTYVDASFAYAVTPMIADILAIQALYGTANTLRTGNTTYGYNSNAGGYYDDLVDLVESVTMTILDNGGTDTLDLSLDGFAQIIDLNDETISSALGLTGNISIARGTVIENFRAGSGDDTVTGNEFANLVHGNDGRDLIRGLLGNDTLNGGDGNDILHGGGGVDQLRGDYGKDRLFGGNGNDNLQGGDIKDFLYGDEGNDSMFGGTGADLLYGRAGDDSLYGEYGNDYLEGGAGRDRLEGGSNDDILLGGDAIDTLLGGVGNDTLDGGRGNDILTGDEGVDSFLFSGSVIGADLITDFVDDVDLLSLAQGIWGGGLTIAEVIDTYASNAGGDTLFDFGAGNTITVAGIADKSLLADDILLA